LVPNVFFFFDLSVTERLPCVVPSQATRRDRPPYFLFRLECSPCRSMLHSFLLSPVAASLFFSPFPFRFPQSKRLLIPPPPHVLTSSQSIALGRRQQSLTPSFFFFFPPELPAVKGSVHAFFYSFLLGEVWGPHPFLFHSLPTHQIAIYFSLPQNNLAAPFFPELFF